MRILCCSVCVSTHYASNVSILMVIILTRVSDALILGVSYDRVAIWNRDNIVAAIACILTLTNIAFCIYGKHLLIFVKI